MVFPILKRQMVLATWQLGRTICASMDFRSLKNVARTCWIAVLHFTMCIEQRTTNLWQCKSLHRHFWELVRVKMFSDHLVV